MLFSRPRGYCFMSDRPAIDYLLHRGRSYHVDVASVLSSEQSPHSIG